MPTIERSEGEKERERETEREMRDRDREREREEACFPKEVLHIKILQHFLK
jgi:hypothetical protein